ncbi:MAG: uracil-DNA glycosylase family protein [Chitinophagaceae bacterium]
MKKESILKKEIKTCITCKQYLPNKPNPIFYFSAKSKIIIIGQAPGRIVDETGIPWNDKSGDTLRKWLGVDKDIFYDEQIFATIPMGFCYPGTGKNGDLAPRPECAALWHERILNCIDSPKLILLIGKYAQDYYLGPHAKENLTQTVLNFEEYFPKFLPLPHPSPRNNIWIKKNPWFESQLLPILKEKISKTLNK